MQDWLEIDLTDCSWVTMVLTSHRLYWAAVYESVETGATGIYPLTLSVHVLGWLPMMKGMDQLPLMEGLTTTGRPRFSCAMNAARNAALSSLLPILLLLGVCPNPKK